MEPKIIYEDEHLLVVDKSYGITVNRSETTKGEKTLQDWIEERDQRSSIRQTQDKKIKDQNQDEKNDFLSRAGIVHRLDKETSGILLVAKSREAFENLQKQFKERIVKKTYTALAHGKVSPEAGEIKVPVGRLPWNRKRFGVVLDGREALTKYKVLSIMYHITNNRKEALSLLELYPETGRTHQIRIHLKYIGHPIFADYLYAGRKTARDDRKHLPRVFLHASKISFQHPSSGNTVSFESPLPKELEDFLGSLLSEGV